jgi:hypothetical protein
MKRLLRIVIVSLAAAVVLFVAAHLNRAQGKGGKNGGSVPAVLPATSTSSTPGLPHVLVASYMTQGLPEAPTSLTGSTWYPEESNPLSFKCLTPCTLEIQNSVNLGDSTDYSGAYDWYLETLVDGSPAPIAQLPDGTDIATVGPDGASVQGTLDQFVCLPRGTHTVQTEVKSDQDANLFWWENNYRVYIP